MLTRRLTLVKASIRIDPDGRTSVFHLLLHLLLGGSATAPKG